MALERDDLDELNRPPRRIRAVSDHTDHTNTGEGGERVGRMGEPTLGELLLTEVRDMKNLLATAMTEQARMRVQVDVHEQDIRDIKVWRDTLPEKTQQREAQHFQMTWQTVGGILGVLAFLASVVGPHIHIQ